MLWACYWGKKPCLFAERSQISMCAWNVMSSLYLQGCHGLSYKLMTNCCIIGTSPMKELHEGWYLNPGLTLHPGNWTCTPKMLMFADVPPTSSPSKPLKPHPNLRKTPGVWAEEKKFGWQNWLKMLVEIVDIQLLRMEPPGHWRTKKSQLLKNKLNLNSCQSNPCQAHFGRTPKRKEADDVGISDYWEHVLDDSFKYVFLLMFIPIWGNELPSATYHPSPSIT